MARLQDVEELIAARATVEAIEMLSGREYVSNQIAINDQDFLIAGQTLFANRTYRFSITPIVRSRSGLAEERCKIQSVGFVSQIEILFPAKLRNQAQKALRTLESVFKKEYRYLEARFLEEYGLLQNILFEGLEPILLAHLAVTNVPQDAVFLALTSMTSGRYSFHLGTQQLQVVLEKLVKSDQFPISPLMGIIGFIWDDAVGGFFQQGILSDARFVTLPFKRIFALEGTQPTNQVQNYLFGARISVLEVSRANFSLQVNCSPTLQRQVELAIKPIKKPLSEQFEINVRKYARRRSKFAALWRNRRVKTKNKSQLLTAVIIEIISQTLSDISARVLGLPP